MTLPGEASVAPVPPPGDKRKLRDWWHEIIREHGHYKCSAVFLAFSADIEISKYLKENADELNSLSGDSCLVISISDVGFVKYQTAPSLWYLSLSDHIAKGYSNQIAKIFRIKPTEFPCLLVFRDVRSPDFVKINLKGLKSKQIVQNMRLVFSIIANAVTVDKDPLAELKQNQRLETLKLVFGEVGKFTGKTLEIAMEAAIKASIK